MIDITTNIRPIQKRYPTADFIEKWVGDIAIKGGEDGNILHWHIENKSPKSIVETQICALESMRDAIEKRIKILESSLRD